MMGHMQWWELMLIGLFLAGCEKVVQVPVVQTTVSPTVIPVASYSGTVKGVSTEVLIAGPSDKKQVALTLNAVMSQAIKERVRAGTIPSQYNQQLVDYLVEAKVPVTFFVTGMWAEVYPTEAKQLADNPLFEIGNLSYSYPGFTSECGTLQRVTTDQKQFELAYSQATLGRIIGVTPTWFRFPGLCHGAADIEMAASYGLRTVDGTEKINNGSILMFDFLETEVIEKVVNDLKNQGYELITLSQMGE